jgi:Kef-type K+ transport system membrane component KefB
VRWLFLVVLGAVAWSGRLLGQGMVDEPAGSALLGLGCLVIGGVLAAELAPRFRLPQITGFLLLGMVAGPHALGLVTLEDAEFLRLFEELALGLIALTAGGEFRWQTIRRRVRPLLAITLSHTVAIFGLVAGFMWILLRVTPYLGPVTPGQALAAVCLLGVIAVAVSPSTTIAVITELHAKGELTETVLGVTILKDLVILLLFAWVNALALGWVRGGGVSLAELKGVGLEIVVSLVVGCLLGLLLGAYLARVGRHVQLTVLLLALVSVEMGHGSHLVEHLLVCMAAGFTVRNVFPRSAEGFIDALEQSSPPIYTIFFALIGAGLDLRVFWVVWLPATLFVIVRGAAVWLTTRLPAAAVGAGPQVVRRAWMGFIAQAGLSLGLAARIRHELPDFGATVATLVVAAVVVNQLIGPVLWARALWASGEAKAPD